MCIIVGRQGVTHVFAMHTSAKVAKMSICDFAGHLRKFVSHGKRIAHFCWLAEEEKKKEEERGSAQTV
jgi:hypothetical protein